MPGVRKIEAGAKNCPVSFWNTLEIYTVWHWNISSRMTREREVNYSVGDVFGQVKKMNMVFLTIIVFFPSVLRGGISAGIVQLSNP